MIRVDGQENDLDLGNQSIDLDLTVSPYQAMKVAITKTSESVTACQEAQANVAFMESTVKQIAEDIISVEIKNYSSIYEFPNQGSSNAIYIDTSENATYRWDDKNNKYYCVGRDYSEISDISGGSV